MALCKRLREFLDREMVRYEVLPHPEVFTAQEVAATSHVPGWRLAKVVMARDAGGFLMAVIPAPARVQLEALGRASGRRGLRLATEAEFRALFPDCEAGSMPPFGNLYGLPLYLEESLTRAPEFLFQGGTHQEVVRLSTADYLRLAEPTVAELAPHEAKSGV